MRILRTAVPLIWFLGLAARAVRAADPVVIVSPEDGAVVPPQFPVKVTFGDVSYCDTDGCDDLAADQLTIVADGTAMIASCYPCFDEADFDVMLTPGQHELVAIATLVFANEYSKPIKITVVEAEPTTGDETGGSGSGGSSGAGTSTSMGDTTGGTDSGDTTSTGDSASAGEQTSSDTEPITKDGCACDVSSDPNYGFLWVAAFLMISRWRCRGRRGHLREYVAPIGDDVGAEHVGPLARTRDPG